MQIVMGAVGPFPGIPQSSHLEDKYNQAPVLDDHRRLDWTPPGLGAMTLREDDGLDLDLSADRSLYVSPDIQRDTKLPGSFSILDAPHAWQPNTHHWHAEKGQYAYDLHEPHGSPPEGIWTTTDQETSAGGSSWSPHTSDRGSEADYAMMRREYPQCNEHCGLAISFQHENPACYPDDTSYRGLGSTNGISPHAVQQFPDDYDDEIGSKADLQTGGTSLTYYPDDTGCYGPPTESVRLSPEAEVTRKSIQYSSELASSMEEDNTSMDEDAEHDDDDDWRPRGERHSGRLPQRSPTMRKAVLLPKRSQRTKPATNSGARPSRITKKAARASACSPTSAKNTNNHLPCAHCPDLFPSDSTLKKHLLAKHERPFLCSFRRYGCDATLGSKNEWKRHINVQHLRLETWRCNQKGCAPGPYPGGPVQFHDGQNSHHVSSFSGQAQTSGHFFHEFDRKDLFTQHLKRMHAPAASATNAAKADFENSVDTIQMQCRRKLREPPENTICPFCPGHPVFSSWDERVEHVGRHLEKGDFDRNSEQEDVALRNWMERERLLHRDGRGWRMVDTGKKKRRTDKGRAMEEGEEDAEGEDE